MMRHPDWQVRLLMHIEAAIGRPFVWGESDCCLFTADACIAVAGVDPAAVYRGRYTTEIGARRVLLKEHGSIAGALDACFERIPVSLAQRGDAVVFDGPSGETAGVIWAGSLWAMTEDGARPLHGVIPRIAWRVSCPQL
ncbi:DUF6950 family protein [Aeromonas veronii]|uniref:DUF6950 family protein n=1 Tax=Aeromonas veronii TaxID=654 RepID=UPI00224720EC|nr:hypothetical protein [Aeromonas veronii]MCX0428913.1 hypothetical protein [Aeromonas veronii]MCX0448422.1 hypothetical protein [Aeromonas veronii]